MWTNEQATWIGNIGRAAFVLLFLIGEGRPVRAREVSRRLNADYETAREYLFKLAELGAALHTPAGWRPTPAACGLLAGCRSAPSPPNEPSPSEPPAAKYLRRGDPENPVAGESRGTANGMLCAVNPPLNGAAAPRLSGADRLNALLPRPGEPILIIKVNQALKDSILDSFNDPESLIITIGPENAAGPRPGQADCAGEQGCRGAGGQGCSGEPLRLQEQAFVGAHTVRPHGVRPNAGQQGSGGCPEGEASENVAADQDMQPDEAVLSAQDMLSSQDTQGGEEAARLAELGKALHRAGVMPNARTRHLFDSEHLTAAHVAGSEHQLKKRKGRHYQPGLLVVALEGIQPGDPPAPVGFDGENAGRYAEWND